MISTYAEQRHPGIVGWTPRVIQYAMPQRPRVPIIPPTQPSSAKLDIRLVRWEHSVAGCLAPDGAVQRGLYSMPGEELPDGEGCTVRWFWDCGDNGFVVEAPRR